MVFLFWLFRIRQSINFQSRVICTLAKKSPPPPKLRGQYFVPSKFPLKFNWANHLSLLFERYFCLQSRGSGRSCQRNRLLGELRLLWLVTGFPTVLHLVSTIRINTGQSAPAVFPSDICLPGQNPQITLLHRDTSVVKILISWRSGKMEFPVFPLFGSENELSLRLHAIRLGAHFECAWRRWQCRN